MWFSGDRGLEVRGHGGGSHVPVDLRDRVCGGHPGLISPACLPESHHSHSAARLRHASYVTSSKACLPEDFVFELLTTYNIVQGLFKTRIQGWCI